MIAYSLDYEIVAEAAQKSGVNLESVSFQPSFDCLEEYRQEVSNQEQSFHLFPDFLQCVKCIMSYPIVIRDEETKDDIERQHFDRLESVKHWLIGHSAFFYERNSYVFHQEHVSQLINEWFQEQIIEPLINQEVSFSESHPAFIIVSAKEQVESGLTGGAVSLIFQALMDKEMICPMSRHDLALYIEKLTGKKYHLVHKYLRRQGISDNAEFTHNNFTEAIKLLDKCKGYLEESLIKHFPPA